MAIIANCRVRSLKNLLIDGYRKFYQIGLEEAEMADPHQYQTFNDFFTRRLKPGARPIAQGENVVVCPVDGTVVQAGKIVNRIIYRIKGFDFNLESLLAEHASTSLFRDGQYAIFYLAPSNYHRIHMPITGKVKKMTYIPGKLFSVNPAIIAGIPDVFTRNERVVVIFDTAIGPMAMVLVGAMIVGSIETAWAGKITPSKSSSIHTWDYSGQNIILQTGQELGHFKMGSTVVLLSPKQTNLWNSSITSGAIVRVGQRIDQ